MQNFQNLGISRPELIGNLTKLSSITIFYKKVPFSTATSYAGRTHGTLAFGAIASAS